MSNVAILSNNTLFQIGNGGGSEVFTTVPGLKRISGISTRFDLKDVTDHDDSDFFREFIAGLSDGDVISISGNWRPSNIIHRGMRDDNLNATRRHFKVVYPDSSPGNTCAFTGFIQECPPTTDIGEPMEWSVRIKMVGAPVWT